MRINLFSICFFYKFITFVQSYIQYPKFIIMNKRLLLLLSIILFFSCTSEKKERNDYADKLDSLRKELLAFSTTGMSLASFMDLSGFNRGCDLSKPQIKKLINTNDSLARRVLLKFASILRSKYDYEDINIRFRKLIKSLTPLNRFVGDRSWISLREYESSYVSLYYLELYNELHELEYEILKFRAKK